MAIYIGDPDGLTWTGARAKVRGDLWRPGNSLSDDVLDRALHASVIELESECQWLWLENLSAIFTLDVPAAYIDVPPAIGRISSLSVRTGVRLDPLMLTPLDQVREMANGSLGNFPGCYALGDGRIWLDSTVPVDTEFEIIFSVQTPDQLELALESNSVAMQRQQQAVIANACHYVALGFLKNADEAGRQRAVYDRILDRLMNDEAQKRGGMIQPDTWGMGCG